MVEILLFLACLICIRLKKAYCELAENHQAGGERKAHNISITLKHTGFLNFLFDLIALVAFVFFSLDVAFSYDTVWAASIIFAGLCLIFVLLPILRPFAFEKTLALGLAPVPAYFLKRLEKPIDRFEDFCAKLGRKANPARPISKRELKELLTRQLAMADEDMKADVKLALAGLELNREKAGHLMVMLNKTKTVKLQDEVGPVLLSELHKTGRKVFPAEDDSGVAGTVRLDRLAGLRAGGKASEALDPEIISVNKDEPILGVIRKFIESGAELVFVENPDAEITGLVYLEDVLKQLL